MRGFSWVVAPCLALALGACSSDDADDEPMDSKGGEDAAAPASEPDAGADDGPDDGDGFPDLRGTCDIDSGWRGDEACLPAPDSDEGMQIRVGPATYEEADTMAWRLEPGQESSQCYFFQLPNDDEIWFQTWELSGRPGTHHIINSLLVNNRESGWGGCVDLGTGTSPEVAALLPGASKPYMPRAPVAPENENLGSMIPGGKSAQADMHYFNFGDEPLLREFWLNVYYVDRESVTEEGHGIRGMGGLLWLVAPIAPGTHRTYEYACPIEADGRIIRLIGHTHKHGVRETAWVRSGDERLKVFEQYDYLEPQIFEYNSITENPAFAQGQPGAYTGIIDVKAGDVLEWECEIKNDSNVALRYTNEVETGEMCNLWGESVGPNINCVLF